MRVEGPKRWDRGRNDADLDFEGAPNPVDDAAVAFVGGKGLAIEGGADDAACAGDEAQAHQCP